MACFIVPATEAVVTTVANKVIKNKEKKSDKKVSHNPFAEKLGQLNGMLWGGSGLLAFEHLWHGEIAPFFPFLTAASDPSDRSEMFYEMATSGSAMALTVTAAWAVMVLVTSKAGLRKKRGAEA